MSISDDRSIQHIFKIIKIRTRSENKEKITTIRNIKKFWQKKIIVFKNGKWDKEEDAKVINLVKKLGKRWSLISKFMLTRSGKQIRERYLNVLSPEIIKDPFNLEEDLRIFQLFPKLKTNWKTYTKFFNKRTPDNIKNRYYSSIKKRETELHFVSLISISDQNFGEGDDAFQVNKILSEKTNKMMDKINYFNSKFRRVRLTKYSQSLIVNKSCR